MMFDAPLGTTIQISRGRILLRNGEHEVETEIRHFFQRGPMPLELFELAILLPAFSNLRALVANEKTA